MVRCAGGPSGIIAVCIALGALGSPLGDERGTLYFADPAAGAIFRSRLDGSGLQVIISGLSEPMDLALDAARGRLFWCDAGTNKIQSSFLNGSDVRDVVVLGAGIISSIAVDSVRGRLFWLLRNGKIQRAGLDGAGRADVHVFEDPVNLEGIAVDPLSGWIYWSDAISRRIRRAGHDFGWHALVAALETGSSPSAVALDALAGLVCWADTFADRIECSGLDGKNRRTIVTGLKVAKGLALDHHGGKVYWSDNQVRAVYRANMDGSQREELIATGLQGVHGLAVLPMVTTTSTTTSTASTATSTTSYTTTATTSTATTSTTNNITTSTTTCFDVNYAATDLYGDTCGWYASRLGRCGDHDDEDFKADYMCCVCGGGSAGELFKPSTIRTTTTSTTSTFTSTTTTTTEAHRYGRKVPPPTKLALAVRAGATEIEVLISEGFRIGDQISIGDEQNEVVGFGSLVLATPLTKNHPALVCLMQEAQHDPRDSIRPRCVGYCPV
eukprot:TRINITY_DN17641_c0_g1_i2.p1 TRINITY_DN17641_c0_g1~~TRINITY_DN17641_c0_g1_i2.p1  ORF type:complete len:498 (+),score=60.15 TRINITY_DN17641_c0_g1_i2:100-1593(+)